MYFCDLILFLGICFGEIFMYWVLGNIYNSVFRNIIYNSFKLLIDKMFFESRKYCWKFIYGIFGVRKISEL